LAVLDGGVGGVAGQTVLAAANAFMRLSLVLLAALAIWSAVWMALRTGLERARVRPLCLNQVSVTFCEDSRASVMAMSLAWMVMSPPPLTPVASTWLPVWV
jgi:hypothetical protein